MISFNIIFKNIKKICYIIKYFILFCRRKMLNFIYYFKEEKLKLIILILFILFVLLSICNQVQTHA